MKTNKKLILFTVLTLSVFAFFGCEGDDNDSGTSGIVGTWKLESIEGDSDDFDVCFFTFSKDGIFTMYADGEELQCNYTAKKGELTLLYDDDDYDVFTYEIKNKKLYLNIEDEYSDILTQSSASELNEEKNKSYAPSSLIGKTITISDVVSNFTSTGTCKVTPSNYMPGVNLTSKTPTYTYSKTGSKTASFSYYYQQSQYLGSSYLYFNWYYTFNLTFNSAYGGSYSGTMKLNSQSSSTIKGKFTIN
ncbi:MAG: lipocalin family protein [Paludibacteraceae bacterium]